MAQQTDLQHVVDLLDDLFNRLDTVVTEHGIVGAAVESPVKDLCTAT